MSRFLKYFKSNKESVKISEEKTPIICYVFRLSIVNCSSASTTLEKKGWIIVHYSSSLYPDQVLWTVKPSELADDIEINNDLKIFKSNWLIDYFSSKNEMYLH